MFWLSFLLSLKCFKQVLDIFLSATWSVIPRVKLIIRSPTKQEVEMLRVCLFQWVTPSSCFTALVYLFSGKCPASPKLHETHLPCWFYFLFALSDDPVCLLRRWCTDQAIRNVWKVRADWSEKLEWYARSSCWGRRVTKQREWTDGFYGLAY